MRDWKGLKIRHKTTITQGPLWSLVKEAMQYTQAFTHKAHSPLWAQMV